MPPPTAAPTAHIVPWLIGDTFIACKDSDCYGTGLTVTNDVGSAINETSEIEEALFLKDCADARPNSASQFVNLGDSDILFTQEFVYEVLFDQSVLDTDTGGFINCITESSGSCIIGTVEFCTRVTSYNNTVEKAFRETNFELEFDLTNSTFNFTDITVVQAPTPEPTQFPSHAPSISAVPTLNFKTTAVMFEVDVLADEEMNETQVEIFEEIMVVHFNSQFKDNDPPVVVTDVEVLDQEIIATRLATTELRVGMNITSRVFDEDLTDEAVEDTFEELVEEDIGGDDIPQVLKDDLFGGENVFFEAYAPSDPPSISPQPSLSPSESPQPSGVPTSSLEPSKAPVTIVPTESPTSFIQPWLVGSCNASLTGDSILDSYLTGFNEIGFKGAMNDVTVKLFDYDCETEQDLMNSTNAVTIFNTIQPSSTVGETEPFFYDINISTSDIASDTGGFVTVDGTSNQTGVIEFCTRVSTSEGSIEVAFRECNFRLSYSLAANFSLTGLNITERDPDVLTPEIPTDYGVAACQCEDFECLSSPVTILQDESLVVCLFPTFLGNATNTVRISNFNFKVFAGTPRTPEYVEYNPVWFSTDGWSYDPLTLVTTSVEADATVVMVQTPVIAGFFIQGHESINVEGNAFLEFTTSKAAKAPMFDTYVLEFAIEATRAEGCIKQLINRIREFF